MTEDDDDGLGLARGVANGCAIELLLLVAPTVAVLLILRWAGWF